MKKLGIRNVTLLSEGAKTMGSFKEAFCYIEESLYIHEADTIRQFCDWVDDEIGGGSSRNLEILFQAFINPNDKEKVAKANEIKEKIAKIKKLHGF
jgi:hypothetical protein